MFLGMWCVHGALRDGARIAALAGDPRWVYPFEKLTIGYLPQMPALARIDEPGLPRSAAVALASASVASVMFYGGEHANFDVQTGRQQVGLGTRSNAHWLVPDDAAAQQWVELQHAIIEALGSTHAVLVTATNEYVVNAEVWLSVTKLDGQWMHRRPTEIRAYEAHRQELGNRYVRRPRWGTYLKPAHVEAVGGRAKILEVVKPPVAREVGDLFYVQLSEWVSEATSEAARERWHAFVELLAPITVPIPEP
jgi:hypothetical protein